MKRMIQRTIAWALQRRILRTVLVYSEHRGSMLADSITYRALFSVFAAVLLGFSFAALWIGDSPEALAAVTDALNSVIPGLTSIIDPAEIKAPTSFTFVGIISLAVLLGAAIGAIGSLRNALRILADQVTDDVAIYWVLLRNLALAVALGGLLIVASVSSVLGSSALGAVSGWFTIDADNNFFAAFTRIIGILIVFTIDTVAVALMVRLLSGVRARARDLWTGSAFGGLGLVVLQEFSGLFVRGATANPLLASFAALIALLLWCNLSSQVILIASTYIFVSTSEYHDRIRHVYGATSLADWKRLRAEDRLSNERRALLAARTAAADSVDSAE
jgi:membrane protein